MLVISGLRVAVPFLVYLFAVGSIGEFDLVLIAERVRRAGVLGARAAVQGAAVPGLDHLEHPLREPARSSASFSPARPGRPLWPVIVAFALWGIGSHAFGAVQDVVPDREGGIASIATVIGAKATVRLVDRRLPAAAVLLLFTPWPGPLAAILVVPYVANGAVLVGLRRGLRGRTAAGGGSCGSTTSSGSW